MRATPRRLPQLTSAWGRGPVSRTPLTHGDVEENNRDAEATGLDCRHLRLPTFTLFVAVEDVHYRSQLRSIALKIDPHSPVILTASNEIAMLCEHVTESANTRRCCVYNVRNVTWMRFFLLHLFNLGKCAQRFKLNIQGLSFSGTKINEDRSPKNCSLHT